MLLEIAIGDTMGAGFEFTDNEFVAEYNKMDRYLDSSFDGLKAGQYTDDTQMSLAIAELLLEHDLWTPELVAQSFLNTFNRDKRQGYAKGFYLFLLETKDADEFIQTIYPDSERNGAAMRSVPLGLIANKDEMLNKAEIQATLTHNTFSGIFSSKAVALASHYFYYSLGPIEDVRKFVEDNLDNYPINPNKEGRTECSGIDTIDAVFTVLSKHNTLYDVIYESIEMGGDTDSVAAIAAGLISMIPNSNKELPSFFYEDLENGKYGRDYLISLDEKLLTKFPRLPE